MDRMFRIPALARILHLSVFAWSMALPALVPSDAWAAGSADSEAQFDIEPIVACRDVTPAGFELTYPGQRLIEAKLAVSVLAPPDSSRRLAELLIRIESPDRTMLVMDFAPRTTMTPEMAGVIKVDRVEQSNRSLDFQLRGQYYGFADGNVRGSQNEQSTTKTQYEKLSPLELCVASGTVNRGYGAFFKFKPTPRSTLEGAQELSLVLRVPTHWRADWLAVRCESFAADPVMFEPISRGEKAERTQRWTERQFLVVLHEAGDAQARSAAIGTLRAEAELRRAASAERSAVQKKFPPQPWREIGELFGGRSSPTLAETWDALLYGPVTAQTRQAAAKLPPTVRDAAVRYHESRRALQRLTPVSPTATANLERLPPT